MKTTNRLALLLLLPLFLTSCLKDDCTKLVEKITSTPILLAEEDFRTDIKSLPGEPLDEAGKIYVYGNALLINDVNKGIHIVDNSDPYNPQFINFIKIPGNVDMAVRGNYLYADSYGDLLSINVSSWFDPVLIQREKNVFRQFRWQEDSLIIGHDRKSEWVEVSCAGGNRAVQFDASGGFPAASNSQSSGSNNTSGPGIAGSMARFGLSSNYLYGIDQRYLQVFELSEGGTTDHVKEIQGRGLLETIFPFKEYLFIGADNGMYIYDNTIPSSPEFLSEFLHANACDPVFATEDRAYVTLRDGNACINAQNQLDVLNISDITNPRLMRTYPMTNPHGLSVVDETLFLCDGRDGLKIFDVKDDFKIDQNRLAHLRHGDTFDVIALSSELIIVTGKDGIRQYDTTDLQNPKEISFIPTN